MKRSKKVALMLMVPTTTLMLASCGEKPTQALVFSSAEECAAMLTTQGAEQCYADFRAAQALHPHVAPKYANRNECETDFGAGQCEPVPQQQAGSSGFFMPMMMGYLAGQMFNRQGAPMGGQAQQQAAPATASAAERNGVRTQPLYKSRDDRGTFRTATNTPVARQSGAVNIRPSQVQPRVGQFVQRGGFGAQATSRQTYGG